MPNVNQSLQFLIFMEDFTSSKSLFFPKNIVDTTANQYTKKIQDNIIHIECPKIGKQLKNLYSNNKKQRSQKH